MDKYSCTCFAFLLHGSHVESSRDLTFSSQSPLRVVKGPKKQDASEMDQKSRKKENVLLFVPNLIGQISPRLSECLTS